MIFIIGFIVIVIGTCIAIVRSERPAKLVLAEAKYEIMYNFIGSKALFEDFYMRRKNKTSLIKKTGKIAVITGGTRGIGAEVIKMLMQCDMHVVMGCRKVEDGQKVLKQIRDDGVATGELQVYELDISSLASVRAFSKIVIENYSSINYLINNAGIMYVPYAESADGYESQFATNYLGHFLLTHLLLPLIKKGGADNENARIVNVASCAYLTGKINFEDINKKDFYISFEAYSQSKLAQVLFTNCLQEKLTKEALPIQVHSIHPGIVNTDLFDGTYVKTLFGWILPYIFKTPLEGATTIVHTCLSPEFENKGGTYVSNCRIQSQNELAQDKTLQEELFKFTQSITKVSNFGREA